MMPTGVGQIHRSSGSNLVRLFFLSFVPILACSISALETRPADYQMQLTNRGQERELRDCFAKALDNRGKRDTEFFLKLKKVQSKKTLLLKHSINNEERFCDDIDICKQQFPAAGSELLNTECVALMNSAVRSVP